ncbi:MAG: hypothetical protein GX224_03835 [Thermoplasmatales archaeon]|nr:hypothetical protein [Thermoplasmatales archaeon]
MVKISVGKRILLHLDRFRKVDSSDKYNIPWDLTQDGIATSLRISRAHASIELKKLREAGLVEENQAHIKGGKVKRKAYFLTSDGFVDARSLRETLENDGVDIASLLDMKRQDPDTLMDNLDAEETNALGCACAFRVPVPVAAMPKTVRSVIPYDVSGMTVIDPRLRENVLGAAEAGSLKAWHSFAADYWVDLEELGPDGGVEKVHERLYHLVEAGRGREACRLASANIYDLIATANDDLMETLQKMGPCPAKQSTDVLSLRIEADLQGNDLEDAERAVGMLREFDGTAAAIYAADLKMARGDEKGAIADLESMEGDVRADLRRARAFIDAGDLEKAAGLISDVSGRMPEGDTVSSTERFVLLARIDVAKGMPDDARMRLSKAKASTSDKNRRRIDLIIEELGL